MKLTDHPRVWSVASDWWFRDKKGRISGPFTTEEEARSLCTLVDGKGDYAQIVSRIQSNFDAKLADVQAKLKAEHEAKRDVLKKAYLAELAALEKRYAESIPLARAATIMLLQWQRLPKYLREVVQNLHDKVK